ncbi:MAG: murein biosynthesis integral membrane protein MurJ [Treponema sp.]|jgi:putative peptidoglycan lipid II flippase|nr:murein biosynthesis integral membrane protein MurJ [Treponema sp.]
MKEKKQNSLISAGIKLSVLTLISRVLGLIREMTRAAFLGTTGYADAFGIAFQIPNLFRRLFAENSVSVAFIPTFRNYIEDSELPDGKKNAQDFLSATFTLVSFLTAAITVLGIILAPRIVPFFLAKGDTPAITETALLTRIMFPYLFVISIAAFFQGILNSMNIFSPSGFTPILFNIIVISATYLLSRTTGNPARAMSIGVTAGGCVQALFQLPFVIKTGWKIPLTTLKKAFSNKGTRKVLALVGPTIIGMSAYQLNIVVSTSLAGKAGTGILSSLQYSLRLQELILGVFAVSIGTVMLPDLTGLVKRQQWKEFNRMLTEAIKIIALITIPITFYSLISGREIISLVYQSKKFTEQSVELTFEAFRWHIAGLFFIALNRIVAPAFYAQRNTKSPTLAGTIGVGVNILLAILLVIPLKGGGIALALSAASLANSILLFVFLKQTATIDVEGVVKSSVLYTVKIVLFSAVAAVPSYFLRPYIIRLFSGHNRLISAGGPVLVLGIIFAASGILLLVLSKDPIAQTISGRIAKKIKKADERSTI